MTTLNQGAWIPGTSVYRFGFHSIPRIPITGAPADTNFARWAMLHDGSAYRLYAFRDGSANTLYQFSWDGTSYAYGHNSIPMLTLVGAPPDVDAGSLAMLHSGGAYHAYLRRLGDPLTLYQFIWQPGTTTYVWNSPPYLAALPVRGFPADTDWSRWAMLHDGSDYRIYAGRYGTTDRRYQGAWNPSAGAYQFAHNSIPELALEDYPADSDLGRSAMLHDGTDYRFYYQAP